MQLNNIKNPDDVLKFMIENIKYGWKDLNNNIHIGEAKNIRRLYRTMSIDETIKNGIGTCVEQVYLMSTLLNRLGITNKMFCTRIYENNDFNDLDCDEHMHCFVLYYMNDKVYQIEHPNGEKKGIYEFSTEDEAIKSINEYYIEMANGHPRDVTEFFDVKPNLSFKEFNNYINSLDKMRGINNEEYSRKIN